MNRLALTLALIAGTTTIVSARAAEPTTRAILTFESETQIPGGPAFTAAGLEVLYRFGSVPAIAVGGSPLNIQRSADLLGAQELELDRPLTYMMDSATSATNAIDIWATKWWPTPVNRLPRIDLDGEVIDGSGITVGVVDTGIDATHPDLFYEPAWHEGMPWEPKVLACVNVFLPNETTVADQTVPLFSDDTASNAYCDQSVGHGTHVAGIVAGSAYAQQNGLTAQVGSRPPFMGAAPGAKLVGAGLGAARNIIAAATGLDWMWRNVERYGIKVVTNSWGDEPSCFSGMTAFDTASRVSNALVEKGVTVLFAAGNYGSDGATWTSSYSRNATPGIISVANYNELNIGSRGGRISGGSSDGCVASGGDTNRVWTWPDVAAPGTSITSTAARTGTLIPGTAAAPFYGTASGTSMATPHVAGIVALMMQANPELTPAQVEGILIDTATPWLDSISSRGVSGSVPFWGEVNTEAREFVDPAQCMVSPADVADPNGSGSDLLLLEAVPSPERFICRDYRRGNGLVDAYAAVSQALALRD